MNKLTKSLRAYKKCFHSFTGKKDQDRPKDDRGTRAAIELKHAGLRRTEKKKVWNNLF